MNRHKKGKRAVEATPARRFMPLHEEEFAALIAGGALDSNACAVLVTEELSTEAVSAASRGRDYGVVGLLEVTPDWVSERVLYVWDVAAFLVENEDLAIEVKTRLGLYPDLVIEAISVSADARLFPSGLGYGASGASPASAGLAQASGPTSPIPMQLDLVEQGEAGEEGQEASGPVHDPSPSTAVDGVPPPQAGPSSTDTDAGDEEVPGSVEDSGIGLLNRIAGATCLLRHRMDELGLPASALAALLPREPEGTGGGIQSFVEPVLRRIQESLGGVEFAPGELAVLTDAAALLEKPDFARGIDPREFTSQLAELAARGGQVELGLADKLSQTIGKLANSEIELTSARIDDSKQIGLRGLMVFLQTLDPDSLIRWMEARRDVGRGVSLIAGLYSGMYAGLAVLPRGVKGEGLQCFAGPVWYARKFLDGVADVSGKRTWAQDASCKEAVLVSGWTLYESTSPAKRGLSMVMGAMQGTSFEVRVDPDSGAATIQLALETGPAVASLVVGRSRWVAGVPVVRLQVNLVHGGRGKPTKDLLESMLSGRIAPAWVTLDATSSEFSLFIEVPFSEQSQGDLTASSLKLMVERIENLGLVAPREKARVKSPRARRAPKAPE